MKEPLRSCPEHAHFPKPEEGYCIACGVDALRGTREEDATKARPYRYRGTLGEKSAAAFTPMRVAR